MLGPKPSTFAADSEFIRDVLFSTAAKGAPLKAGKGSALDWAKNALGSLITISKQVTDFFLGLHKETAEEQEKDLSKFTVDFSLETVKSAAEAAESKFLGAIEGLGEGFGVFRARNGNQGGF